MTSHMEHVAGTPPEPTYPLGWSIAKKKLRHESWPSNYCWCVFSSISYTLMLGGKKPAHLLKFFREVQKGIKLSQEQLGPKKRKLWPKNNPKIWSPFFHWNIPQPWRSAVAKEIDPYLKGFLESESQGNKPNGGQETEVCKPVILWYCGSPDFFSAWKNHQSRWEFLKDESNKNWDQVPIVSLQTKTRLKMKQFWNKLLPRKRISTDGSVLTCQV